MDASHLQQELLKRHGIRIDLHMGRYILQELQHNPNVSVPVIGGDAHTGVPMYKTIRLTDLSLNPQQQ